MAEAEREVWCEHTGEVKNGYYRRRLETVCGTIKDLRVPRTREGEFRPFFIEKYKRVTYELEEIIIAMYQGGLSTNK